jgi:hypothetical protein
VTYEGDGYMRKEEILKQWTLIFQSSMVFYLGLIVVGLIPMITLEDSLWERNWFFVVLGLILGGIIFIGLIVMIITMLLSIWPVVRKFDYVYILILIITLAFIDVGGAYNSDNTLSDALLIIVFLGVTGVVMVLQLIARQMIKQSNEEDLQNSWNNGLNNLQEVDQSKKLNITKIVTSILVVVVFVALNNFEEASDQIVTYLLILAIGVYVIKIYHETYNILQKQKILNLVFFSISYVGILVILYFLGSFFMNHVVLRSFLVLLPFVPYLLVVIPHFYTVTWLEKNRYLTK